MKAPVFSVPIVAAGIAGAAAAELDANTKSLPSFDKAWEIALSASLMSDNNVRGITQSARHPAIGSSIEPRYNLNSNLQVYGGVFASTVDFPNRASTQIGFDAGVRPIFDKLSVDLGIWYLYYPGGEIFNGLSGANSCSTLNAALCNTIKGDVSFWEAYAKPTYMIDDLWMVGATFYYSPSVSNSGAAGAYAATTFKFNLPVGILAKGVGTSLSGELGRYWFGTTDAFYGVPAFPGGIKLPDYVTWNAGITLSYESTTFDVRYYDTDLSKANCNVLTGDHTATFGGPAAVSPNNPTGLVSNWCGAAFIAKLNVDTTLRSSK